MRIIKENHQGLSTILSFALIPLSGFATDIYLPSLPSMAGHLQVPNTAVQLSLVIFMISYGISQLFVGSLLDSFGRYKLGISALAVFMLASFAIALSHNIYLIYLMRIIHGITVALIVVGKRAYFVDIYKGDKLKHYTSLFSIIWASAPIIAPFIGGYLQAAFGWESNFYFLGFFALSLLVLELVYGGESLQHFHPFKAKSILNVYSSMLKTADFSLGLVILGLCYAMLLVYGMSSPFIIEHLFHHSPIVTGYCSLLSGVALMTGGIISKTLIKRPFTQKIIAALSLQLLLATAMIATSGYTTNLFVLMTFVLLLHLLGGFIFNNFFSYCLGRFSKNAGIASGITGGGMYIVTSIFSYSIVNTFSIKNQAVLGGAYLALVLLSGTAFLLFQKVKYSAERSSEYERNNQLKAA
jgi:MFS family permease